MCSIGSFQLEGRLQVHEGVGLIHYRPSKVDRTKKPQAHLDLWLEHLVLQLADWPGPKTSCLIGNDECWIFPEIQGEGCAMNILAELLDIYWQGLIQPLQFFPKASFVYAVDRTEQQANGSSSVCLGGHAGFRLSAR